MFIKNLLKKIILPILHAIRKVISVLKNHCLPISSPSPLAPPNSFAIYEKEELERSYNHFKKYFKTSIFLDRKAIIEYSIKKAIDYDKNLDKTYLEFGVFRGGTINFFSKYVKKIYGFDSFEGLKEDWIGYKGHPKELFNLNKKIPKLKKNIIPIVGWVQDTLPQFLRKHKPEINFVHMDMDTYETSKYILTELKPYICKNCIILFDELYNFAGWDIGEYKALTEVYSENEYKFLAFSEDYHQVTTQIL